MYLPVVWSGPSTQSDANVESGPAVLALLAAREHAPVCNFRHKACHIGFPCSPMAFPDTNKESESYMRPPSNPWTHPDTDDESWRAMLAVSPLCNRGPLLFAGNGTRSSTSAFPARRLAHSPASKRLMQNTPAADAVGVSQVTLCVMLA